MPENKSKPEGKDPVFFTEDGTMAAFGLPDATARALSERARRGVEDDDEK